MAIGYRLSAIATALLVAQAPAWLERLWRKPEPHIEQSFEKLRKGDAPAAVELMDKAAASFDDPRDHAALAFDKSAAALMIGKQGAPIAVDEAKRALEGSCGNLCAPSAYNLGFGYADQGKRDDAIEAYGKSLTLDARDEDAKYNLELLLREKEEQKQQGGAGQDKKDKPQQGKDKDKEQQSQGDQQQKQDQKPEDKDKNDKQDKAQQSKDEEKQQQKPEQKDQGQEQKQSQGDQQKEKDQQKQHEKEQQAQARRVDRTEAQRLLDALRASEKNLQVWRFGQRREKPARARDAAKDW